MSEKQFPASSRKLKKERERGNLGKVPEITAFISIGALFLIIFIIKGIIPYFNRIFELYLLRSKDFHSNIMLLFQGREILIFCLFNLALTATAVVCILMAELVQTKMYFSLSRINFDFKKLNPFQGLQRLLCGTEGFAPKAFCIAVLKMFLFVVSIFYFLYRYSLVAISTVQHHWQNEFNQVATYHFEIGISIFQQMFAFLLAITLISFFATKKRYQKNLMMTFQELKEEYKESEGSAEVKSRRKEIHQEILLSNIIKSVRKSKVLVVGKK